MQILWRVEREGERLEKPPDCPLELYAVMRKCWACNPSDRPNFTQLGTLAAEVGSPLRTQGRSPLCPDPRLPSQAKPKEAQATRDFSEPRKLALAANDLVTLVDHRWARRDDGLIPIPVVCCLFSPGLPSLEMSEWRGQNQRTLTVGWFPASLIVPPPPPNMAVVPPPASSGSGPGPVSVPIPVPAASSTFISTPVKGSLHHTGHGDVHPDRSWGTPESLDESVLLPLCQNKQMQRVTEFYCTHLADNKDRSGVFLGLTCFSVQRWEPEATGSCQGEGRIQSAEDDR